MSRFQHVGIAEHVYVCVEVIKGNCFRRTRWFASMSYQYWELARWEVDETTACRLLGAHQADGDTIRAWLD